jgi:hypothetical protein
MIAPQTMKEEEDHDEMIHLTKDPLETQNQRGFSPDAMAPGRYREPSRFSECIKIGEIVLQKSPCFFQIVITKSSQFPRQLSQWKKFFTFSRTDRSMLL